MEDLGFFSLPEEPVVAAVATTQPLKRVAETRSGAGAFGAKKARTVNSVSQTATNRVVVEKFLVTDHPLVKSVLDVQTIDAIYETYLINSRVAVKVLQDRDYLDEILLPAFTSESTSAHVISIALLASTASPLLLEHPHLASLFTMAKVLVFAADALMMPSLVRLVMLIHASTHIAAIKAITTPYLSILILNHMTPVALAGVLGESVYLEKAYKSAERKVAKMTQVERESSQTKTGFFSKLLHNVCVMLLSESVDVEYIESVIQLLLVLLEQLHTRRYVNSLIKDSGLISCLAKTTVCASDKPLAALVCELKQAVYFPIHDFTGKPLSSVEVEHVHYNNLAVLQKTLFSGFRDVFEEFCIMTCGNLGVESMLHKCFGGKGQVIYAVAEKLGVRTTLRLVAGTDKIINETMLVEMLVEKYVKKQHALSVVENLPVYPTELTMYPALPVTRQLGTGVGFLSSQDYVYRVLNEYMSTESEEMRVYTEAIIRKSEPRFDPNMSSMNHQTLFTNPTRFGAPMESCKIVEIGDAFIGQTKPSKVVLEITYDLNRFLDQGIRDEWDGFMAGDVLYLASIISKPTLTATTTTSTSFQQSYGFDALRGCQIISFIGDDQKPMMDFTKTLTHSIIQSVNRLPPDQLNKYKKEAMLKEIEDSGFSRGCYGSKRILRVSVDVNQYQLDMEMDRVKGVYGMFNYVVRKERRLNGCREVVEGLKEMCMKCDGGGEVIPEFLEKVWVGGEASASAEVGENAIDVLVDMNVDSGDITLTAQQTVNAGLAEGMTLISGTKGTGKLESAAQIVSRLLKRDPTQRILLISPQHNILSTLFTRITTLTTDVIDKRYILKLGYDGGDAFNPTDAQLEADKYARLTLFTSARAELLDIVDKLSASMEILGAHGNSCETAGYFFDMHVKKRWDMYLYRCTQDTKTAAYVKQNFPFWSYFNTQAQALSNQTLFSANADYETSLKIATECYTYLTVTFETLSSMRAFEILRTPVDQMNYLVTKESKLVSMTATFAMVKSGMYRRLGFGFDTIVYVGADCLSEVEALVSLGIQLGDRLKRVVAVGDGTRCDGSLFGRFMRAGVKSVKLDVPVRPQTQFLARLYENGVVDGIAQGVNPGFSFDSQFINVPVFKGMNESSPRLGYVQNLGEAEYVVAVFMYNASDISILTTEIGQRDLIIDVLNNRCGANPIFGKPAHVSTIASFAGLENAYVLGSLVRTKSVVDAYAVENLMRSARKGLYVFGRFEHYTAVKALAGLMRLFAEMPNDLCLITNERVTSCARTSDKNGAVESGVKLIAAKWVQEGKLGKSVKIVAGVEGCGRIVYDLSEVHLLNLRSV